MKNIAHERRTDKRIDKQLDVEYKVLGEEIDILGFCYKKAKTKNISLKGLCLFMGMKLQEGSVLRLDVATEDANKSINTFCEVEWCRPDVNGYEAGLSFISLNKNDITYLQSLLN